MIFNTFFTMFNIWVHIKFSFQATFIHKSDLSKNFSFCPALVMFTEDPSDPSKAISISSIKLVFIIKFQTNIKCLLRFFCPFDNFFAPIHSHIALHLTTWNHFHLSRVPIFIMCESGFKLFIWINIFSFVFFMNFESFFCIIGNNFIIIVIFIKKTHVYS